MNLEEQIKLIDDLVERGNDLTIKDFLRIKSELEKYSESMRRTYSQASKEKKITSTQI